MVKQSEGGGIPSRGEGGVPPNEDSDSPNVPPLPDMAPGGVVVRLTPEEVDTDGLPRREPLPGCGCANNGFCGGAGTDRSRPCSRRRRMLHVASDSEVDDVRLSMSLVWSFFCLVRRF